MVGQVQRFELQLCLPVATWFWPVGQALQSVLVEEATVVENVFVPQFVQALEVVDPVFVLYLPASQDLQLASFCEAKLSLYLPLPHSLQSLVKLFPSTSLYFPFPQEIQESAARVEDQRPLLQSLQAAANEIRCV